MPEPLNDRIRELFEELDTASPEAPPMPRLERKEPRSMWSRALVPATGVAVVILVLGVSGQILFNTSESGDEATATTVADAADTTPPPAETRPPDRALALAQLNLACTTFVADGQLSLQPATPQEFRMALIELEAPMFQLNASIEDVEADLADPDLSLIADSAQDITGLVAQGAVGPVATAQDTYNQVVLDLGDLGVELAAYGALDCAGLQSGLE